jgi:hypothetical protein
MSAKAETVVTAILASLLALTSCGGDEQVRVDDEETQASTAAAPTRIEPLTKRLATAPLVNPRRGGRGAP